MSTVPVQPHNDMQEGAKGFRKLNVPVERLKEVRSFVAWLPGLVLLLLFLLLVLFSFLNHRQLPGTPNGRGRLPSHNFPHVRE